MTGLVKAMFVSLTEVPAGYHHEYNEWHALDHMPEQYRVEEMVGSHRWVISPDLRPFVSTTNDGFGRAQYFHYYLFTSPLDRAMTEFSALKWELEGLGRFYFHRVGHLNAALRVVGTYAARTAGIDPRVVPFRPATGCLIDVTAPDDGIGQDDLDDLRRWYDHVHIPQVLEQPGFAGCWSFELRDPSALDGVLPADTTVRVYWLDDDPLKV